MKGLNGRRCERGFSIIELTKSNCYVATKGVLEVVREEGFEQ